MYFGDIFGEVQALMHDRELLARQVQLESEGLRARAELASAARSETASAVPAFGRIAGHFRFSNRARLG